MKRSSWCARWVVGCLCGLHHLNQAPLLRHDIAIRYVLSLFCTSLTAILVVFFLFHLFFLHSAVFFLAPTSFTHKSQLFVCVSLCRTLRTYHVNAPPSSSHMNLRCR